MTQETASSAGSLPASIANDRTEEVLAPLARLAAAVAGQGVSPGRDTPAPDRAPSIESAIETAVDTVRRDVALLVREHEGLSNELLRVYEHISIVFDVTRRLLALRSEREVATCLIEHLRATYPQARYVLVEAGRPASDGQGAVDCRTTREGRGPARPPSAAQTGEWTVTGDVERIPEWVAAAVQEAKATHRVCVANESGQPSSTQRDDEPLCEDQVLVAPLFAGESFACAVALWRAAGAWRWESGDMLLLDSLAAFCGDVIRNFRLVQELQQMSMDMVRTLVNAVDQKDPYTSGHSNRVGYYAKLLGAELGFDEAALRTLEWSALLHDVGKIGIRDDVLKKPGKLTDEEYEHIKEHPLRGYEVVRENPHMRDAVDGVLYHHERYDGKGYPHGLKGEAIPLRGRIIQIADIFDALTTTRSYRGAYHWREALSILHDGAGTVVDPVLGATFERLIERMYRRNPAAFDAIGRPAVTLDLDPDGPDPGGGDSAAGGG